MLLRLINYMKGTVRIRVTGPYPERFLNLCMRREILLWDLRREGMDTLYASAHVSGFRNMRTLTRKCKCRLHIQSRSGVPFVLQAIQGRPMLWCGLILFALAIYGTSTRIWAIELVGGEEFSRYELMESLAQQGVAIGVKASAIEPNDVKNAMMNASDDLSFVAINVRGNQVTVEVKKRVEKPFIEDSSTPVSIVSDKTGVIASLDVKEGTTDKKVGQTILAGETLVDALVVSEQEGVAPRLVHASANATLRTWYTYERIYATKLPEKCYTGKKHTRYALVWGKKRINLFLNSGNCYEYCDKITKDTILRISDSLVVPVRLVQEEMREYTLNAASLPQEMVEDILNRHCREDLQKRIGSGEITSFETAVAWQEDKAILLVRAECLESTGVEREEIRSEEEGKFPEKKEG